MPLNIPLAQMVLRQITEHPETHNQESWANECGTVHCIAGWALALSGKQTRIREDVCASIPEMLVDGQWVPMVGGWSREGREVLGLTREQADYLFLQSTDSESVVLLASHIANAIAAQAHVDAALREVEELANA